ncbi:MAG: GNAT family N-acetyltransferase [Thermoplasmata archaeon]
MELPPETLRRLRGWLDRDSVGNAHVIYRAFFDPKRGDILVDDPSDPQAVVVHDREGGRLAIAAEDPSDAAALLESLPPGEYRIASIDLNLLPALRRAIQVEMGEPVWVFRMSREDLRPSQVHGTNPVTVEHAKMIAEHWHHGREAYDYVRSRIEDGLSAGVYADGELVAWDMTHLETDKVIMLGFLYVKEAYRGRGYAKTVTTSMCRRVFKLGKTPACQVFQDNEVSMRLTEGMGFRRLKRQIWGKGIKLAGE